MTPRRLLDLFSGAGGASAGYASAGFSVTGVDRAPQPRYPFAFVRGDAMTVLRRLADGDGPWAGEPRPDAVHASPPCQAYSRMTNCRPGAADAHPDLLAEVRALLVASGLPWVLENVAGSGLAEAPTLFGERGLLLCGGMFGLALYRHRLFETSWPAAAPVHPRHLVPASRAGHWQPGTIMSVAGNCSPVEHAKAAMGIAWMTRRQLAEAIPPAYAAYLGRSLTTELAWAVLLWAHG